MFIEPRALITVHEGRLRDRRAHGALDLNTELINAGDQVGALVYGLLDAVVDGHAEEKAPDLRAGYDGDFGEGVPPCR